MVSTAPPPPWSSHWLRCPSICHLLRAGGTSLWLRAGPMPYTAAHVLEGWQVPGKCPWTASSWMGTPENP